MGKYSLQKSLANSFENGAPPHQAVAPTPTSAWKTLHAQDTKPTTTPNQNGSLLDDFFDYISGPAKSNAAPSNQVIPKPAPHDAFDYSYLPDGNGDVSQFNKK